MGQIYKLFSLPCTPFQKSQVGVLNLYTPKKYDKLKRRLGNSQIFFRICCGFLDSFPVIFRWPNLHGDEDGFLGIAWTLWSLGCRHPLPKRWQTWLRFGRLDWPWWTQGTKSFHVLDLAVPLDAGEECFRNVPIKFFCSSCRCVSGQKVWKCSLENAFKYVYFPFSGNQICFINFGSTQHQGFSLCVSS